MPIRPYLLVSKSEEAARHRHSLLRLLPRFRLVVGCFCFILARFLLEFDDLHLRSAVDPSHHGSSVLHTLLHVAQWPCVPSGVTSTFAPQSSHFGLAMLSMEANNFWCQVDIVVKRLETLRRDDTIHSCNVRHHYQYEMHTTCMCASGTSKVAGGRNSSSSSFLGNRASPKNGRPQPPSPDYCSRERCTHQTCRNDLICLRGWRNSVSDVRNYI